LPIAIRIVIEPLVRAGRTELGTCCLQDYACGGTQARDLSAQLDDLEHMPVTSLRGPPVKSIAAHAVGPSPMRDRGAMCEQIAAYERASLADFEIFF